MIKIAPSILAADFTILEEQLQLATEGGADWIHIDIMDGHFVPNITFGPQIVAAVNRLTSLPLDVHLMVKEPDHLIPQFIAAGADILTVQIEAVTHINRTLNLIKQLGAAAGVAINPGTAAASLEAILDDADLILAMTVNPGFGGQTFISSVVPKIKQISELIAARQKNIYLEVDGGIAETTIPLVITAGANVLVMGTTIFQADDIRRALKNMRQIINQALI